MTIVSSDGPARNTAGALPERRVEGGRNLQHVFWSAADSGSAAAQVAQPWLDMLCEQVRDAITGFVLLRDSAGAYAVVASKPIEVADQVYMRRIAEQALISSRTISFRPPRAGKAGARPALIVASPMTSGDECFGAVVLLLGDASPAAQVQVDRQIESALGWFHAARIAALRSGLNETLTRSRIALRALAVVDEHETLDAAAMQLAAHLEAEMSCDRVSVGVLKRRRIRVAALSHSSGFDRRSAEARRLQAAMEEAADQDVTVVFPQLDSTPHAIALAHRGLGPDRASLSVVLRGSAGKHGVITLERPSTRPFTADDVVTAELMASLVAPALAARGRYDEWFSGRAFRKLAAFRDGLLGPRRPMLKLTIVAIAAVVVFLVFATGQHRVPGKAVVEGLVQRAASAPFDGFIASAQVRAGAVVKRGEVLATLDDHDLRLEQARWAGEREQRVKQYNDAFAKHDRALTGVLAAQVSQAESQLALAEENLARAQIVAPIDGLVVAGDLSQLVGSPVEKGKVLFELAPLESYRVILNVDERDIGYLKEGQVGELAISGIVGERVPFRVKNITSVTTADEGKNLFRVEAELLQVGPGIRPGMEGVGKVEIGERRFAWIWTHRFVDWLRLKLWTWLP